MCVVLNFYAGAEYVESTFLQYPDRFRFDRLNITKIRVSYFGQEGNEQDQETVGQSGQDRECFILEADTKATAGEEACLGIRSSTAHL